MNQDKQIQQYPKETLLEMWPAFSLGLLYTLSSNSSHVESVSWKHLELLWLANNEEDFLHIKGLYSGEKSGAQITEISLYMFLKIQIICSLLWNYEKLDEFFTYYLPTSLYDYWEGRHSDETPPNHSNIDNI